ncbi:MAG: isoamylase [Planctomycetota bacterium]
MHRPPPRLADIAAHPERGASFPLGASVDPDGVNFCVYARHATGMELLLFADADDDAPARTVRLDPRLHRTDDYWHVRLSGAGHGLAYGWRADGPHAPEDGRCFDPERVLLDPYARAVEARPRNGAPPKVPKSYAVDLSGYDWEGDAPLRTPFSRTVIYEMHVRGFTQHPSSGVAPERRGTYAGVIDKIPYLVDLGVTAVELLPIFEFDETTAPPGLTNYWGYNPIALFAPHAAYATDGDPLTALDEFRDMVKALHRAGIEVLLDVVYNHTAEGGAGGTTYSFRGLDDDAYYIRGEDRTRYADFTGTGNTLNANHSVVRRLIRDSLCHWARDMHVDGFRFDLASIFSRAPDGTPIEDPPVVWGIDTMPELAGTKLIAEAWDAGGLYQVGSFRGKRWKEWNGRFRDDVRRFLRGDRGSVTTIGQRFLGSPDIYGHRRRGPELSVNFVTCHDGFTMNDLVSYERKHNSANGEDDRDGTNDNFSANHGVEGPSDDAAIEAAREQQIRTFFALTLLSLGTPMILMGDEMRRTQGGNNNAYCQDNDTNWLDWTLLERHRELHAFVRRLIRMKVRRGLDRPTDGMDLEDLLASAEIRWHGVELDAPDWGDHSHSIAFTAKSAPVEREYHVILSAHVEPLTFALPDTVPGTGPWRRVLDTSLAGTDAAALGHEAEPVSGSSYTVAPRSLVVLSSGPTR